MEELLQKLLEAEILTEDTRKELEDAFKAQLEEATTAAKDETAADVRAELTEQWVTERDNLIEAIDTKVGEMLVQEIAELKEDIESFRDLEAEYAEKLVEAKGEMGDELKGDLKELVEKIDSFLEMRLKSEMSELKEDIAEVRKNDFGRRIFEAVEAEFNDNHADKASAAKSLRETKARLADTETALEESESKLAAMQRTQKLDEVLSPLAGQQRDVMEAILKTVPTDKLEEGYKTFIGRVIRESEEDVKSEKEDKVLAEDTLEDGKDDAKKLDEGVVVTGDETVTLEESEEVKVESDSAARLRKLAGIG